MHRRQGLDEAPQCAQAEASFAEHPGLVLLPQRGNRDFVWFFEKPGDRREVTADGTKFSSGKKFNRAIGQSSANAVYKDFCQCFLVPPSAAAMGDGLIKWSEVFDAGRLAFVRRVF